MFMAKKYNLDFIEIIKDVIDHENKIIVYTFWLQSI